MNIEKQITTLKHFRFPEIIFSLGKPLKGGLAKKIKRMLKQKFELFFKFNSIYKPNTLYTSSQEYITDAHHSAAELIKIFPQYITELSFSEDLYNSCSSYAKPEKKVQTDYQVLKIPNGRIYTDNMGSVAIISHNNRLIGDVSFQYKDGHVVHPSENIIFFQKYFCRPVQVPGTVFSMLTGGGAINNYGHWLIDAVPRLHLLKESGLFDEVDWFLVPSLSYDFQIDTLKLLNIPFNKIIEGDKVRHLQADHLIASTAPRGSHALIPQWVYKFLNLSFSSGIPDRDFPKKVHISRKDSNFRRVLNEDEMEKVLISYGFETVVLSKLSFTEKVKLFSQAEIIIGASGAGLTNTFFCKSGCKIIELFSEGFVLTDYINIASLGKLDHHYLISKSSTEVKNKKQGQRSDLVVDLEKLKLLLERVLVNKSMNQ